jgi:pilus assembly protein CpaF
VEGPWPPRHATIDADVPLPNVASTKTRPARGERPPVDLRRLAAGFLRMAPDVAIVGEVRDREALPLLLTLSSGVKGFTTIHAGSARQALTRLRFICQLSDTGNELPMSALNHLVAESIDIVVHCARGPQGPTVETVLCVEDLAGSDPSAPFTVTEVFSRPTPGSRLAWTGAIPSRAAATFAEAGADVRSLLDAGTKR